MNICTFEKFNFYTFISIQLFYTYTQLMNMKIHDLSYSITDM